MKAFITVGCKTNHGGIILLGDSSYIVEGKAVHLDGMTHYCPKCQIQSKAIASNRGFITVNGKSVIVADDTSTCGAKFLKISDLVVMDNGAGSNISSSYSNTKTSLTNSLINNSEGLNDHGLKFQIIDEKHKIPVPYCFYLIINKSGQEISGFTNNNGFTEVINTGNKAEDVDLHVFDFSKPMDKWE